LPSQLLEVLCYLFILSALGSIVWSVLQLLSDVLSKLCAFLSIVFDFRTKIFPIFRSSYLRALLL
jgi:hypothetical protein